MKIWKRLLVLVALGCVAQCALAGEEKLDLYLLIGQSNMAGRGEVEARDKEAPERVFTLNKGNEWVPAVDPLHFDKKQAGVGPGRTFGIAMAKADKSVRVGLIPCAVGGTSIRKWKPGVEDSKTGAHPYDDMLVRLKVAMKSGTVRGILWHQGEADGKMGEKGNYGKALTELIGRVRAECGGAEVPFLIGQLGQFEGRPWSEGRRKVDAAQQKVAASVPHCGFVSSDGLEDRGDLTHFSAEAARELGKRYADAMIKIQQKDK